MSLAKKLLDIFKLETDESNISSNENKINGSSKVPKYCTDLTWIQDGEKSITKNGLYDLKNFSTHEEETIKHIYNLIKLKYPEEYQSLGLANESYAIKYKPRYILFEIIIVLYSKSDSYIDMFAVALAYESKGAFFRKQAIEYFEKSIKHIKPNIMNEFVSYMPLHVYTMFSKLYEQEHDYANAIYYIKEAKKYADKSNKYFDRKINDLQDKANANLKKRVRRMSKQQKDFEKDVHEATIYFLKNNSLQYMPNKNKEHVEKVKNNHSEIDINKYAIMCNAQLEHDEEMEQYKKYYKE